MRHFGWSMLLAALLGTGAAVIAPGVAADVSPAAPTGNLPTLPLQPLRPGALESTLPFLDPAWRGSSLPDPEFSSNAESQTWMAWYLQSAAMHRERRNLPVSHAFVPAAVDGKLMFRTYDGLFVVNLRERDPELRNMWAQTDGGVTNVRNEPNKKAALDGWLQHYRTAGPQDLILRHSMNGSVTTDRTRALLVDDLILPPYPVPGPAVWYDPSTWDRSKYGPLRDLAGHNSLKAYNLETMKLQWSLGGKRTERDPPSKAIDELADSLFLGPPLSLGGGLEGRLYILNEKAKELRLICLEAKDKTEDKILPPPDLVWVVRLDTVSEAVTLDVGRRIQAVRLAAHDDVVVCPTNAGLIAGVSSRTGAVLWLHTYRKGKPPADLLAGWQPTAPGHRGRRRGLHRRR
jgi:hypothetical protein